MINNYRKLNPEVLFTQDGMTTLNQLKINEFKKLASENSRRRVRLCTHGRDDSQLHEMFILFEHGTYIRPHKHIGKSESVHIVEGAFDMILFSDSGEVENVIRMGDYSSGKEFYFRSDKPVYHSYIIRSSVVIIHETTTGPFDRTQTIFADWAPQDEDNPAVRLFVSQLERKVSEIK